MIHKINRYSYWFALTLLITGVWVLLSKNTDVTNIAMIFLLTLAICTFLNVALNVIFKFQAPWYFQYHQE
ncbi:MAG: hypothetical protein CVU67_06035 [Deltaproteobacteria bacterium HGW-Deltaproteobacteria-24]|nr:MAG: hypothetical protein CVU67_06035 [Deltaproteobacteria bacterium HGW-Deltaproteobacteria-24]